ncbi:hypothetical protein HPB52_008879 [Rhipicephalus sanguineus]|uniref:Uncharacterized protein n=1 Tax=Rhipicephalus sanguineus TaxID=34632 RepID=A0A9D4PZY1_RHISA|nr:hypothetical protein HPB52_008879 [Rhipicephalus sanguineus]
MEIPFKHGCYLLRNDRSPIHTGRTEAAILENLAIHTPPWSLHSADLYPIENVAISDALWQAVNEELEPLRLSPGVVVMLYESMPRRVQGVIAAYGRVTSY